MPKDREIQGARQRLERPVSCRFCRSRKLLCSREAPCSNCVSRGIVCELPVKNTAIRSGSGDFELLERIRRLEELVANNGNSAQNTKQTAETSPDTPHSLLTRTSRSTLSPDIEHLDDDVGWLKRIYTVQIASDNALSNKIAFRVCPIQQIPHAQYYISRNGHLSPSRFEPMRCVWLPQYAEAKILLQKFFDDIDHVHHIIHTPSLPAILDEVYACLSQQSWEDPGNILLLLGIFASSTHAWVHRDNARGLFPTWQEANAQAQLWVKAVEDMLDILHRISSVSIEGIQGISITTFALLNMEGFSRRCKSLFNMAFMLAREIGLHSLDQPSNANSANSVQTEIGRRVWWFLVAADWYCVPKISHNMVDRSPLVMGLTGVPNHDVLMGIDTELQILLNDTPPFFSMSVDELIANYSLDRSRATKIAHQGYLFCSLLYAQRCTLHIPYFTRGLAEPAYASSSQICLQSARLVIQTESHLGKSGVSATRYRFLGFLVPVFMASIVLVIQLCYHKTSSHHAEDRGKLTEAIQILEEAKYESQTAAKFLNSLTHVLRKHEVSPAPKRADRLPITPDGAATATGVQSYSELLLPTPAILRGDEATLGDDMYANGEDLSTYFHDLAQSFDQGVDVASLDWNNMFSGIDSSMTWV
ncbi:conserved hypothetical protein [Talaromyces stipitatus ATCC 10500]|uniref:Zn(2)-C6 fungal-type domain-containing protein n=1 Tax=Talaromyces stipitatus (strain ATCC 10500 / CBS 375.48 / QM 6759 / NRRL 1006) TaxID=441959 RepID=B8MLT5_TALSN|nr:uncharacterized protein TSTA_100470 [Talaromyces stipitatus ATCC 10500]EED13802.1 conserved hypothetical protein [Talaromyces stipitatus ATCC 10500]